MASIDSRTIRVAHLKPDISMSCLYSQHSPLDYPKVIVAQDNKGNLYCFQHNGSGDIIMDLAENLGKVTGREYVAADFPIGFDYSHKEGKVPMIADYTKYVSSLWMKVDPDFFEGD